MPDADAWSEPLADEKQLTHTMQLLKSHKSADPASVALADAQSSHLLDNLKQALPHLPMRQMGLRQPSRASWTGSGLQRTCRSMFERQSRTDEPGIQTRPPMTSDDDGERSYETMNEDEEGL